MLTRNKPCFLLPSVISTIYLIPVCCLRFPSIQDKLSLLHFSFLPMCTHVCVCGGCMCLYVCRFIHLFRRMWRPEVDINICSSIAPPFFLKTRSLSEPGIYWFWLNWLARKAQKSTCLSGFPLPPVLGLQVYTSTSLKTQHNTTQTWGLEITTQVFIH